MTFDELQKRAIKMFGRRWKPLLAKELHVHLATVYRWAPRDGSELAGVPQYVDTWFELQESRKKIERFARSLTR